MWRALLTCVCPAGRTEIPRGSEKLCRKVTNSGSWAWYPRSGSIISSAVRHDNVRMRMRVCTCPAAGRGLLCMAPQCWDRYSLLPPLPERLYETTTTLLSDKDGCPLESANRPHLNKHRVRSAHTTLKAIQGAKNGAASTRWKKLVVASLELSYTAI